MKKIFILSLSIFFLVGCFEDKKKDKNENIDKKELKKEFNSYGTYFSEEYKKRLEGYDWVAVDLQKDKEKVKINIFSRADVKKKQTCSYKGFAQIINENKLLVKMDEKDIFFTISDKKLTISPKLEEDANLLFYYCNGGASLRGEYYKLDNETNEDLVSYKNKLEFGKFKFDIYSNGKKLVIKTNGLKHEKEDIIEEINSPIVNSQIADINEDGNPEIYLYLEYEENNKKYSDLIAYSVNKGVSLSDISIEPLEYNKEALNGFQGNDTFKIVNNKLIRSFPLDTGVKTIEYKLQEGESSWQLKINKIKE